MNNNAKYLNPNSPANWPKKLKTDEFQLFLDYDGTLAPFNENPDKAYPVAETNQVIRDYLKNNIPVTIVTGRNALDIKNNFIKPELPIIGLHGREFLPSGQNQPIEIGPKNKDIPDRLKSYIQKVIENNPVELENKDNAYAIHIKNNKSLQESIYEEMNNKLEELNIEDWEIISGRKVIEIRFSGWNKANAIKKYRNTNLLAIYIGDDRTDEDVFNNLNKPGVCIYVKNEDKDIETNADYYLKDPSEVIEFLKNLLILSIT